PRKEGFPSFKNFGGESIAMIEWRKHPVVEIFGTVSMRTSAEWLRLSPSNECAQFSCGKRDLIRPFTGTDSWLLKGLLQLDAT
ncbi:hypothetical protein B0H13DRAFT_1589722, partial [Mycena leptocephala]